MSRYKHQGFSLIEIIIVMVIIAIATAAVVLSVGVEHAEKQAKSAAQKIEALFIFAQNKAVLTQKNYGFITYTDGYSFLQQNQDLSWGLVAEDVLLTRHKLPQDVRFKLNTQQESMRQKGKFHPEIFISADGYTDAFQLIFVSKEDEKLIVLENSSQGKFTIHS